VNCEICDEEFDTENQLMQHKAQMHAGQTGDQPMPEKTEDDENLEEPDYKRAVNE
jgi:hypothetical protein